MAPPSHDHSSSAVHWLRLGLIGLLFAAFPSITRADRNHVTRLTPNGVDDTAQLQAALETCVGAPLAPEDQRDDEDGDDGDGERRRCTIVLSEGVFHTDVLLVHNFRGRLRGQGKGRTIIRPIGGTLRSADVVFVNPPTLADPYPILLHFADGGDIRLSHFTLDFPETLQVEPFTIVEGDEIQNALLSAIMVDGTGSARLHVSGLEIIAADRPSAASFGSVLMNAIRFEGQIRFSPDPMTGELVVDSTIPLASGEFIARDNSTRGSGNVFALRDARNVRAHIYDNRVRDARLNAINLVDMGNSQVRVEDNFISSGAVGMFIFRGRRPSDDPTTFTVEDNRFAITDGSSLLFDFPSDGIVFTDVTPDGGIDRVLIRDNKITLLPLGAPGLLGIFEGIFIHGDRGGVRIVGNKISGAALDAGIFIDNSIGTRTRRNDFSGLEPGPPDVFLTETTNQCRVFEPGATVLDLGLNNIVDTTSDD